MATFSILGDSISTFEGCIPEGYSCFYPREGYQVTEPGMTWWGILSAKTGYTLLLNDSYSASRISMTGVEREHSSAFISRRRLDILPKSDILIVFGGTNDFGQNEKQATLKRFTESYSILVHSLISRRVAKEIYFATPLSRYDYPPGKRNSRGYTLRDAADAIIRTVKRLDDGSLRVIDLSSIPVREGDGLLEDIAHPTPKGMEMLADIFTDALLHHKKGF